MYVDVDIGFCEKRFFQPFDRNADVATYWMWTADDGYTCIEILILL